MNSNIKNLKRKILIVALMLIVGYGVLCFSSLKDTIGRHNPRIAALFSPPWFNFSATYSSGRVLDFTVNMNRLDLIKLLRSRYANVAVLVGGCGENAKFSMPDVRIESKEGTEMLMKKDVLCIRYPSNQLNLILTIRDDSLVRISVAAINSEM